MFSINLGDLRNEEAVLKWLVHQLSADEIEDVTHEMFEKLVKQSEFLAVLFCMFSRCICFSLCHCLIKITFLDDNSKKCKAVLKELENIDDDTDKHGIPFVKVDDKEALEQYGIDSVPAMIYFEEGVPNIYEGKRRKFNFDLDARN